MGIASGAAGIGRIACDTVGSTNEEALRRARTGETGPLWITARTQTAGRGRRGRAWVSAPGNLFATLLLTDPAPPKRATQLSFVAALAVHDAIVSLVPGLESRLTLKWPNDVLCDGAKLAGILIEAEGRRPLIVAVGIGVNCRHHPAETDYRATDVAAAAGAAVSAEAVFEALSGAMARRMAEWQCGFAAIRAAWLDRAGSLGGELAVRLGTRELSGRFEALDEAGRLVLRLPDGRRERIAAGEVFPVAPDASAVGR